MSSARILVVDDSLTIRRALELILKPLGFELDFAADGAQALERATAFNPDLILLDYVLPDMRAPDVCAALAATPTTAFTPIILVSAKGASIRQAYQDAQNVVSYITKPFKPQVVASVVQNALARPRPGTTSSDAARPALARSAPLLTRGDAAEPRPARATEAPSSTAAPESMEQAFAALLAQLEGAMCDDRTQGGAAGPARGTPFAGVSPRIRQAAARLDDVTRHLHGDAVMPFRMRDDGSFANVAATLLDAHRALCEAAILLAAAGAPSAVLPRAPDVLLVCPEGRPWVAEIETTLRTRDVVAVTIGDAFEQLPHLMRLLTPRAVVGVRCGDARLEAALERARRLDAGGTRWVAFVAEGATAGNEADDPRWSESVHTLDELAATLATLAPDTAPRATPAPDIDLEVVAI